MNHDPGDEPIEDAVAIVGLACRFPGAEDPDRFWDNLVNAREGITFFSPEELAARGIDGTAPGFVPAGGVLPGIDEFDAEYFGISPRDADLMDPQHRLFLQCAVHALEDAGLRPDRGGDVGVYAAAGFNSYFAQHLLPAAHELGDRSAVQWLVGTEKDYLATQLSYRLGLTGPSLTVQSACSSALVAVHLAGEALLSGECSVALAGAVSIGLGQDGGYHFAEGGITSPDGHCRPFDADAQGTVFGSGVGAVVLKRLADAVADGDPVRAVLLGSAVTNDGSRKVGFTAPGLDGQYRVITAAHRVAGIEPEEVSYLEAHGTGTALGDQIELAALSRVFQDAPAGHCVLGSVKSNVGHLDTCAGMAGLIKTVLSLQHRRWAPTVHFRQPHPDRGLPGSRFRVLGAAEPWPGEDGGRIAGVSSFGIGGTNAHLVLREAPPLPVARPAGRDRWQVVPVSARDEDTVTVLSGRMAGALDGAAGGRFADAAHTLQLGRGEYRARRAVLARTGAEAAAALRAGGETVLATAPADPVFVFPGQGNGYPGMAAQPRRTEPGFAAEFDRVLAALETWTDAPLRALLLDPGHDDLFDRTEIAQPALFAVEYALAAWWLSLGVSPAALIGHSVGEYTAACVAGVFSVPDAARLVVARGRLMATTEPGAMLSVPLPESGLGGLIGPDVALAAVNAPDRCVLSGAAEAVAAVECALAARGVTTTRLATRHAFHSHHMDSVLPAFTEEVRAVTPAEPRLPIISTVTGRPLSAAEATSPEYWARQVREPVRFAAALAAAPAGGPVLELGPGRSLSSAARRASRAPARPVLRGLAGSADGVSTPPSWLEALAAVWARGTDVRWEAHGDRAGRRRIPLPGYPFARDRHWYEPAGPRRAAVAPEPAAGPRYHVPDWTRSRLPAPAAPAGGTVVVLSDAAGLGDAVAGELRGLGRVAVVEAGGGTGDFAPLVARLRARGLVPDAVVLCRAFDDPDLGAATAAEIATAAESAIADPLFLARSLGDAFPGRAIRLLCVTRAAQAVGARPPKTPHSAAVLGPVRAIPLELPGLSARCLDLWPEDGAAWGTLAERVCAELFAADWPPEGPELVAVHGRARWLRTWPEAALDEPDGELPVPAGGTCLVTGGLGGIGGRIALRLARAGAGTLVLLGRAPVPDSPLWTSVRPDGAAAGPPLDADASALLSELAETGAAICLAQADVSDEAVLGPVLDRVRAGAGPITGVVHAAGVAGGAMAHQATRAGIRRVLAAKVAGTVLLHRMLRADRPGFFALCSSTMAVSGVPGQSAYSGANAFLDGFAHSADGVLSIGWDGWAEIGMAARAAAAPAPSTAPSTGLAPFDHPLFDARGGEPDGSAAEFRLAHGSHTRWLGDEHRLGGVPVLPGSALLELAVAAYRLTGLARSGPVELSDVQFLSPVRLPRSGPSGVVIRLRRRDTGFAWEVVSAGVHARGVVAPHTGPCPPPVGLDPLLSGMDGHDIGGARAGVVATGPRWDCVAGAWSSGTQAAFRLRLDAAFDGDFPAHPLHPALFDVATGVVAAMGDQLPVGYRRLVSYHDLPGELYAWVRRADRDERSGTTTADVELTDPAGVVVARVEGFLLRRVPSGTADRPAAGLATGDALAAFDRVLANRHLPHIVVHRRPDAARPGPAPREPAARPSAVQAAYLAPRDETETLLAEVWGRLLGVPRVGVEDNLFELGGDSLLIVQIAAEAQRLGLAVSPGAVFENPTVARLAAAVSTPVPTAEAAPPEPPGTPQTPDVELDDDELATVLGLFASGTRGTP